MRISISVIQLTCCDDSVETRRRLLRICLTYLLWFNIYVQFCVLVYFRRRRLVL